MIRAYQDSDRQAVIDLFLSVQQATDGLYPDQEIIESKYGDGVSGLEEWLDSNPNKSVGPPPRFVAVDENDQVIGHYQIEDLGEDKKDDFADYWQMAFSGFDLNDICVIKKMAVTPDRWGQGVGKEMVKQALSQITAENKKPSAVCLDHRDEARELYQSHGALLVGNFPEPTGARAVSYIFSDSNA